MAYSTKLSKFLSLVLRHRPDKLNLAPDQAGWVSFEELVSQLQAHPGFHWVTTEDVLTVVYSGSKQRLDLKDGQLRAVYGHSLDQPIQYQPYTPPPVLYHGSTPKAAASILREGLHSMNRQYVHFSATMELAHLVGGRRTDKPVILVINAAGAAAAGHSFYQVDDDVWLSHFIPPQFIQTHTALIKKGQTIA